MTPDKARFLIFDDKEVEIGSITRFLDSRGHEEIGRALTVEDALTVIKTLAEKGESVDVAFVDGNFTEGMRDGSEGLQIATEVRTLLPGVQVIALSSDRQSWSDIPEITKQTSIVEVEKRIRNLPKIRE